MPKISIIVPVHNAQDYLHESLGSIVGQTLDDIEVICVDDKSDDASARILREYSERDPRVRVITFPENKSVSQARKDGVLASTGEYIMFVDADDALELDACERLYAAVQRDPVDILHFGTVITAQTSLPRASVEWLHNFIKPYDGVLDGSRILEGAFSKNRLYNFSLWDKLYSAEVCKKGFSRVKDGRYPRGEDKYAYFLLSYYAQSYRGLPDEALYHYHFGRGGTGHNLLSWSQFQGCCSMGLVADAIREFLVEEGSLSRYEALYANARDGLLQDCVANWSGHLGAEDRATGFDLMLEYWEAAELIAKVAKLNWGEPGHAARSLRESRSAARNPREVRVVGTFYYKYANGGAERVQSSLIKLWIDLGYRVVLLTDDPPSPDDYDLPEGVRRVVLPSSFETTPGNYLDRARALEAAIEEHGIDVMVYHAWVSSILVWDLLMCKAAGIAFATHCHSVFSLPLRRVWASFAEMPSVYSLCDAVITLSEVDRAYWSNYNDTVVSVANPLTFSLDGVEVSGLEGKNVLWLGRMSDEKRPHDALRIFAKVLDEEPDARLLMVGSCPEQDYMASLHALIAELGIESSVEMCGFQKEVLPFYRQASVLLMTSEFEGSPLALSESQSAGVPCVMYGLPYLTLTRPRRGLVVVEMGDVDAAADAVADLLHDRDYRRALGGEARANVEEYARFDYAGTWRGLFEGLSLPAVEQPRDETTVIMWETLLEHYSVGARRRDAEIGRLKKQRNRAQADLRRVRTSWSFRFGHAIMSVPRILRKSLSRLGSGRAQKASDRRSS